MRAAVVIAFLAAGCGAVVPDSTPLHLDRVIERVAAAVPLCLEARRGGDPAALDACTAAVWDAAIRIVVDGQEELEVTRGSE